MEYTTSSEFVDWLVYMDEVERRPSKEDIYNACLTAEVRRSWVSKPNQIKDKDFLLKQESRFRKKLPKEEIVRRQKAYFSTLVGAAKGKARLKRGTNGSTGT